MTEIYGSIIAVVGGIIIALINKVRKDNKEDHGIVAEILKEVRVDIKEIRTDLQDVKENVASVSQKQTDYKEHQDKLEVKMNEHFTSQKEETKARVQHRERTPK